MATNNHKTAHKPQRLCELLRSKRSLLIVMQDNPDPDSIAAAAALRRIANTKGEAQCSIAYGGVIGRAENRAIAEYLGLNFRPFDRIDPAKFDAVALVDTQPNAGNNSLPTEIKPDIVLDHHPLLPSTRGVTFTDVRRKYGAVSTILFEYLKALDLSPDPPLATALLYAIRTDTQDLGPKAVQADIEAVEALYPLANTRMLSTIQRGSVDREYFGTLARALERARLQGPCIVTDLGDVTNPDMIAETADLLLRHEGTEWALCHGVHHGKMWISLRTSQNRKHAGEMMRRLMTGIGTGGGHEMSAGGQIPLEGINRNERLSHEKTLRERFLRQVGAESHRSSRLVRASRVAR